MSEPLVSAILLTADRPEMTRRAIACFEAQTYPRKELIIFDTSHNGPQITRYRGHFQHCVIGGPKQTIGTLRNEANLLAKGDLIAHWDSDDHSHCRRLEEQVALLQATGAQCVGYNDLLFWDTRRIDNGPNSGLPTYRREAWRYCNPNPRYATGATLLYRRELWETHPFDDAPHEDRRWLQVPEVSAATVGVPAIQHREPRFIAQIHADGTEQIPYDVMQRGGGGVWSRAAEFDSYCQERMKL